MDSTSICKGASAGDRADSEHAALLDEITAKLLHTLDPATGAPAITRIYRSHEIYQDRGCRDSGPDVIVGYAKGTRCSDESAIGSIQSQVFADNTGEWSGDHCMDHTAVPGILLANRILTRPASKLSDVGGAILAEFGIEMPVASEDAGRSGGGAARTPPR